MTYSGNSRAYMERMTEYVPAPSRPVIVVPGFGNSRLYDPVDEKLVWGLGKNLIQTKYDDDLDLPVDPFTGDFGRDRLVPDGSFAGSHAPFNIAFALSSALHHYGRYANPDEAPGERAAVYAFAYDWRLSATVNAKRLDEFIDSIRARWQPEPPKVDLVAHSAGGLIALTYLKLGGLGPEAPSEEIAAASAVAASKVSSVTLIGVPQHGTNEAVRALARGEKLIRRELPPPMMASFPSLPELLPSDGTVFIDSQGNGLPFDVWDAATWEQLGFSVWAGDPSPGAVEAFEHSLDRAHRLRALLERPMPEGVREIAIASDCVPTAGRILLRDNHTLAFYPSELHEDEQNLGQRMFVPGDGSIEAQSALGEVQDQNVFCAGHHGMASDPNVHRALVRALLQPSTDHDISAHAAARSPGTASMETGNPR